MIEPTPEVIERILQAIRGGNFRAVAARWGGVEPQDLKDWLRTGKEEPESPCGQFRKELLEAETQAEITCVALVMKAAREDAKQAEWWLSHKLAQRWGKKLKHEVTYVDPKRTESDHARDILEDDQLRHLLDQAAARAAELEEASRGVEGQPGRPGPEAVPGNDGTVEEGKTP
jgi:RNase H-fold protein (predicted Holliday junction resolvase)